MHTIILLVLSIVPYDQPLTNTVDVIELNHFYDENGKHVFDQLIFYDWNKYTCRHDVVAWRLVKDGNLPTKYLGRYRSCWSDGGVWRTVYATSYRESWTQYDPELVERSNLDKNKRRGLLSRPDLILLDRQILSHPNINEIGE